jgi:ribosomal protein S1
VGDVVKAKIIKMDAGEQKVGLSIKAVLQDLTQEELRAYMEGHQQDSGSTIGDAMKDSDFLEDRSSAQDDEEA